MFPEMVIPPLSLDSLFHCLITPSSDQNFPHIQSKLPLAQLDAISSCLIAWEKGLMPTLYNLLLPPTAPCPSPPPALTPVALPDTHLARGWLLATLLSSTSLSKAISLTPWVAAYLMWATCLQGLL